VEAGPEGHPRVERQDDIVRAAAMASPGRPDDDPAADAQDREMGLPGVGPILFMDQSGLEIADRPQAERLEMAERLGRVRERDPDTGSTVVPPGAKRDRISLTASTASVSAATDSSSQTPAAEAPSSGTPASLKTGRP
jgi:hypothetical protein